MTEVISVSSPSMADLSGIEQLQALLGSGKRPPMSELVDIELVEIDKGRAVFTGMPGPQLFNPMGTVHGGYAATLLDSACGIAVHSMLKAGQRYTTLELKVSYLRAMTGETGMVRAEGTVTQLGRRAAFAEARLTDANGRLMATATSTLLVMAD